LIEMATKSGRSWKLERASVDERGHERPRSNKYSDSDSKAEPASGTRSKAWVGGYTRLDGTHVHGYYRSTHPGT
jgi:hypothetical protein